MFWYIVLGYRPLVRALVVCTLGVLDILDSLSGSTRTITPARPCPYMHTVPMLAPLLLLHGVVRFSPFRQNAL